MQEAFVKATGDGFSGLPFRRIGFSLRDLADAEAEGGGAAEGRGESSQAPRACESRVSAAGGLHRGGLLHISLAPNAAEAAPPSFSHPAAPAGAAVAPRGGVSPRLLLLDLNLNVVEGGGAERGGGAPSSSSPFSASSAPLASSPEPAGHVAAVCLRCTAADPPLRLTVIRASAAAGPRP